MPLVSFIGAGIPVYSQSTVWSRFWCDCCGGVLGDVPGFRGKGGWILAATNTHAAWITIYCLIRKYSYMCTLFQNCKCLSWCTIFEWKTLFFCFLHFVLHAIKSHTCLKTFFFTYATFSLLRLWSFCSWCLGLEKWALRGTLLKRYCSCTKTTRTRH